VRKAVMILLALAAIRLLPRALRAEARALGLFTLLLQSLAAAANTSKTYNAEIRTSNLETRVGNLEQGQFANLQSSSVIGTLQRGIFTNVSGGSTITMETQQGSCTLHCGALSNFTSGPQTTFLAGLQRLNHLTGQPFDNNTGPNWATGERGYINNLVQYINDLDGDLQNKGYMN
jgi:hypothetical protein